MYRASRRGQNWARSLSLLSLSWNPCSISCMRRDSVRSAAVSREISTQGMASRPYTSRWTAAISVASMRSAMLGPVVPDDAGCRDAASAAVLDVPGRCWISNFHGSVRCLRRKRREFVISSSVLSPKIFTNGLWSVTITRLSQPWVKYLVCSKHQATAKASPLIAAQRPSADDSERDPARVTSQPSGQQSGICDGQLQCFCNRK